MDAVFDGRAVLAAFDQLGLTPPDRLVAAVAVFDAFAAWRADDPLTPLLEGLPALSPEQVPAALDEVAERLARTGAAQTVLTTAMPAANRHVALALGAHAEEMIATLRTPYLKATDRLVKLAAVLPTDDPADAIAAGDAAVRALRALPEVVATLEAVRTARINLDRRLGVVDPTDPMLFVRVDDIGAALARSHWADTGPGGRWLPLARAGFEFWLPIPAEAAAERRRQAQSVEQLAEAQRQADIHAPGSLADMWTRHNPAPTAA